MKLALQSYQSQQTRWPRSGRHILAQFDAESVVVYQAFNKGIARYAEANQKFGGGFGYGRMSWIKPNFLWMMYRSGWGSKTDQEAVLAIRIRREAFESILAQAVHSSFVPAVYKSQETWKESLAKSDVRLQWDPDHGPTGAALERRAIQLGLRGEVLAKYGRDWILEIQDVSALVREQRVNAAGDFEKLAVPREEVYVPVDPAVAIHLGIAGK